jgi:uncharacterized protein (TIGR02246 family)
MGSRLPLLPGIFALVSVALPSSSLHAQERREVPPATVHGSPVSVGDAQDIQQLVDDFRAAWSRQDTEALMALHSDDVEWINAYARMFQGAQSLAQFLENRLFPNFPPEVSRGEAANMQLISTRYMENAAVIHMYTDGERGDSRNAGEDMRRTHLHLVLERQSAGWRIVHTAIMDAR